MMLGIDRLRPTLPPCRRQLVLMGCFAVAVTLYVAVSFRGAVNTARADVPTDSLGALTRRASHGVQETTKLLCADNYEYKITDVEDANKTEMAFSRGERLRKHCKRLNKSCLTNKQQHRKKKKKMRDSIWFQDDSFDWIDDEQENSDWSPSNFAHILIDENRKLLFCVAPKVASTNFKRMFLILSGNMNTSDPGDLEASSVHGEYEQKYLTWLNSYSEPEILDIIDRQSEYLKIMFVREPLKRLLSAYRNKFQTPYNLYFKERYGTEIIGKYRPNASPYERNTGKNVTFYEFVQYVVDSTQNHNPHWKAYHKLCHPCVFNYDFVGKYETLYDDVALFLKLIKETGSVSFPASTKTVKTTDLMETYYANITSKQLQKLYQIYSLDYKLFGYPYPPEVLRKLQDKISSS